MITFLHLTLYRWVIFPLLVVASHIAAVFDPKVRAGLNSRKPSGGKPPWLNSPANLRPIWFHCSSGELEYAKPVIQLLRQRRPDLKIILTYFSPSVEKSAKNFLALDFALPVPWDSPLALTPFLRHHQPRLLAMSRTDTWPELVYLCRENGIPSILFSATLSSEKQKFKNPLSRAYHAWIYSRISSILCVSNDDRDNFKAIGAETETLVAGDTRYDQVYSRLTHPKPLKESLKPGAQEIVFVAGSTWPDDEERLFPALAQIMRFGVRPIIAPHEPSESHLQQIEARLRRLKLPWVRYTKSEAWEPGQVLVIDCVGILAELYQWGRIAFVGNSFRRHAIHSVMEPLAAGCVTFMGPFHENNREAIAFRKIGAGTPPVAFTQVIRNSKDFETKTLELINQAQFTEIRERIRSEVRGRMGASARVVAHIESRLKNGPR